MDKPSFTPPQPPISENKPSLTPKPPEEPPIFKPSEDKPKDKLVSILVFLLILVSGVAGYFGFKYYQSQLTKEVVNAQPTPSPVAEVDEALSEINKTMLSDVLAKYCINKKVELSQLPFVLSQSIKTAYQIKDTIDCYVPDESYARTSIIVDTPDFSGDERVIYFFHKDSKWMGMGDGFQPISNYKPVIIDGQSLWLNVRDPGPYGISTLGVWADIIGEKKDSQSGTIVRVIDNEILKDQDLLELVVKYGEKQTDPNDPEYIIRDRNKKAQFIEEIVNLASQHSAFKIPAQNVVSDLEGITF